jgi:hypothetical protein
MKTSSFTDAPSPLDYIDARSIDIWNLLYKNITVAYHEEKCYQALMQNNIAYIYVPHKKPCTDCFARELLRIDLWGKGICVYENLKYKFSFDDILNRHFRKELIRHISNCLEYHKILPVYIDLGFDRTKFTINYFGNGCDQMKNTILQYEGYSNKLPAKLVKNIIALYFSIKANPNIGIDNLNKCLKSIYAVNNELVKTLENLWTSWNQLKIKTYIPLIDDNYFELFTDTLSKWAIRNIEQ